MKHREAALSLTIVFILLAAPLVAEAQQTKFWAVDIGNYWDYSDTWPSRVQVTLDTTTFPFPTYLLATTEYQYSTWVPMENYWYEIHETGPNSSELRVWKLMSQDGFVQGWSMFTSTSGLIWAKRPMTVGDSWTSFGNGEFAGYLGSTNMAITINSAVLAYESVDVPFGNGTYNAYKIRHFIDLGMVGQYTQTIWVVPYLGIIKHEYVGGAGKRDYLSAMDIATVFNDAPYDHWAYPYIMDIYDAGLTAGCADGWYCPEDSVTREQMAVFILRALNDVPADGYCGSTSSFFGCISRSVVVQVCQETGRVGNYCRDWARVVWPGGCGDPGADGGVCYSGFG